MAVDWLCSDALPSLQNLCFSDDIGKMTINYICVHFTSDDDKCERILS